MKLKAAVPVSIQMWDKSLIMERMLSKRKLIRRKKALWRTKTLNLANLANQSQSARRQTVLYSQS
jgi:hypothetical protein